MKRIHTTILGVCLIAAMAAAGPALAAATDVQSTVPTATDADTQPDCPGSWRAARLICAQNATGLATGIYGGTDFFLTCNGETRKTICTSGNEFRYIMEGAAPGGPAVRCALSGDSVQVNEKCGPLHLIVN